MIEKFIEQGLFASRWLMAPFYIGLAIALGGLTYSFLMELVHFITSIQNITQNQVVLGLLSLIDLSLAGNLILIVIFSGYENFVSKFEIEDEDQPDWKGSIDFATLKLKLISSMVAISGIQLLKIFMTDTSIDISQFKWLIITHLTFVLSGLFLAIMDFISGKTKLNKSK